MKVRDSGMPEENIWDGFHDIDLILSELLINSKINDLVEIGCGYGTFTIPAAKKINGQLYAFDIEKNMLDIADQKIIDERISNVVLEQRDILEETTGLKDNSMDYVMLFNILHNELPELFFTEIFRVLKPKGKVGILHWRSDISTPRGPDLSIRPTPGQILEGVDKQRFVIEKEPVILEPYHFGLVLSKRL
jgi:ubiquinone/menaquinone biosynthesis C-methylase UbiE